MNLLPKELDFERKIHLWKIHNYAVGAKTLISFRNFCHKIIPLVHMERDINNRKQGVQTHEAVLNTLQIKKLKTIMNHISMKELWN